MADARRGITLLTTRELNKNTKAVLERAQRGDQFIIVRRGMPVAAIGPVSRAALEAYVIANSPEIQESLARADEEAALGKARPLLPDPEAEGKEQSSDAGQAGFIGHGFRGGYAPND